MNNKIITSETVEETPDTKVSLKLLQGGKSDDNWLASLEEGTVFTTRPHKDQFGNVNMGEGLVRLQVMGHSKKSSLLFDNISRNQFMVDTVRFSRRMELFEVLGKVGEPTIDQYAE